MAIDHIQAAIEAKLALLRGTKANLFIEKFFYLKQDGTVTTIGSGNDEYALDGLDKANNVILRNIKTGNTKTIDPIQAMSSDGGASIQQQIQSLTGNAQQAAAGGSSNFLQTMLGLTQPASLLLSLKKKGGNTTNGDIDLKHQEDPFTGQASTTQAPRIPHTSSTGLSPEQIASNNLNQARQNLNNVESRWNRVSVDSASFKSNLNEIDRLTELYQNSLNELNLAGRIDLSGTVAFQNKPKILELEFELDRLAAQRSQTLTNMQKASAEMGTSQTAYFDAENHYRTVARPEWADNEIDAGLTKNADKAQSVLDEMWTQRQTDIRIEGMVEKWNKDYLAARNKFFGGLTGFATSIFGTSASWNNIFKNGASTGSAVGAIASFAGLATSLKFMNDFLTKDGFIFRLQTSMPKWLGGTSAENLAGNSFGNKLFGGLKWLSDNPAMAAAIVTGVFVLLSWLRNRKSSDEIALNDLNNDMEPSIWNPGPVMLLTAGVALSSMGINLGPNAPAYQSLSMPQIQLTKALSEATGTTINDGNRYSSVFVQQGEGSTPTRMMWVNRVGTDANGNAIDKVETFTFAGPVTITNPGDKAYIPALITDPATGKRVANPMFAKAIKDSNNLANGATAVNASVGAKAILEAAARNKTNSKPK